MVERLLALTPNPLKMLESPAVVMPGIFTEDGGNARITGGGDGISCTAADGSFGLIVEAELDLVERARIRCIKVQVSL